MYAIIKTFIRTCIHWIALSVEIFFGTIKETISIDKLSTDTKPHIADLPNELLHYIFNYLPHLNDRKELSLVCSSWNELAFDYVYLGCVRFNVTRYVRSAIEPCEISRVYRNILLMNGKTQEYLFHKTISPATIEAVEDMVIKDIRGMPQDSFIRLPPNVHTLRVLNNYPNLPLFTCSSTPSDTRSSTTKLTYVSFTFAVNLGSLEQICRCSPLLSHVRFDARYIESFKFLSSLSHLKVIYVNT